MEKNDLTSEDVVALGRLLDQSAIRDVIGQYFYSLGRRDFDALDACFTPDVHAEYFGGKAVYAGREAIVEALRPIAQFKFTNLPDLQHDG
jgi:ketosteroid isomerase-like protein